MYFQSIVLEAWRFGLAGGVLAIVSLIGLLLINRFDDPPPPRVANRGIKERLFWIGFLFIVCCLFVFIGFHFFDSNSSIRTSEEKISGLDGMIKEAGESLKPIDLPKLRNVPPTLFYNVQAKISQINDSYSIAPLQQIEQMGEFVAYETERHNYFVFLSEQDDAFGKLENIRSTRERNNSCESDYAWKLQSFRIESRFENNLSPLARIQIIDDFRNYAVGVKDKFTKVLSEGHAKISAHMRQIVYFFEFLEQHFNRVKDEKEDEEITMWEEKEHLVVQVMMAALPAIGVIFSVGLIYVLIQLIRHREEDYLNGPSSQSESLNTFVLFSQIWSYSIAIILGLLFVGLLIANKVSPRCQYAAYKNNEKMQSFDLATEIGNEEFFKKCAHGTSHEMFTLFHSQLRISTQPLVEHMKDKLANEPLDTPLLQEVLVQHELNNELYRFLGEMLDEDDCATGVPKEELKAQRTFIGTIITQTDQFIKATNRMKEAKLQKVIYDALFNHIGFEIGQAVEVANKIMMSSKFNCHPIAVLHYKCWNLNCREHSFFDEALIHWLGMATLFMIIAFVTVRINKLNFKLAEEWEVRMANQPRYFGRNTSNPRYVNSEARVATDNVDADADTDATDATEQ